MAGVAPKPGDQLQLRISDIAFGGEGVARTDDFVVFVPFAAPGDLLEGAVTEVNKRFARAKITRLIEPSAERATPECRYFGECGGCQYQHLAYETQLRMKHKQISDLFVRIGGFEPGLIAPVVGCPQPYGYRNRLMLRSQWDKFKQGLNIGFIRADNRLVVDIEECKIAEPAINQQILHVRAHPPPKGGLKVVLRIAPEGWHVPRDSFFQNNFFLLPQLVETVRGFLCAGGARRLVDAYCGVGFFCIEAADLVESFVGIELDEPAIRAARRNAAERGRTNGQFIAAAVEEVLPGLLTESGNAKTAILIDPPRKGCRRETLDAMRQAALSQIIYVSCDPATMARDLNILCVDGVFGLSRVMPLDMFPQTSHVEAVADLRRLAPGVAPAST